MTTQTYRELCEALKLVSDAAEQYADGQPFLGEWRKWARVVLAGLCYSKTARRAAQSALEEGCGRPTPLGGVAKAAALAATGVLYAVQKDDDAARAKAAEARHMIESIDVRRRDSGTTRVDPSRILSPAELPERSPIRASMQLSMAPGPPLRRRDD